MRSIRNALGPGVAHRHRRARQHDEIGHVCVPAAELQDALLFDDLADAGAPHVHEWRGCFDRHRLLEIADGQNRVKSSAPPRPAARCPSGCRWRNPCRETSSRYGAGRQVGHGIDAAAVGDGGRLKPVSTWVATTVTTGSTAPLSSRTVPLSSAVACAHADVVNSRIASAAAKERRGKPSSRPPR